MSSSNTPATVANAVPRFSFGRSAARAPVTHYLWAFLVIGSVFAGCRIMASHAGYVAVGMIFLLAVVVSSLWLSQGPVLTMAVLSMVTWHYFFMPPLYSFKIEQLEVFLIYGLFLLIAVFMLINFTRQRELARRERQSHAMALLSVTQSAALSLHLENGLSEALRIINAILGVETSLFVRAPSGELSPTPHGASTFRPDAADREAIQWCYRHKVSTGSHAEVFPEGSATWFPMQTTTSTTGVLGVRLPPKASLDDGTRHAAESFACQLALVLEKEDYIQTVQQAEMIRASDRLRHALLDSVSHELKTPLAVMQSATDALMEHPEGAQAYGTELRAALRRMRRIVDNLLNMTRLESKAIKPVLDWCEVDELCDCAVDLVGDALKGHAFTRDIPKGMPLVELDRALMEQALANLLINAAIHTPSGCEVVLRARYSDQALALTVEDRGPGLPPGDPEQLFKQFQRGQQAPPGGSGLGLSIARGFARAHGGDAMAHHREGGGATFTLVLPVKTLEEPTP